MLNHLDEIQKAIQDYGKNPAIALYAHPLGGSYHPGDDELIALFDTQEQAQTFVQACRRKVPVVEDQYLRCFKKGTILYHYVGWGDCRYEIALPWHDFTGVPRNLSAEHPYPDGEPCMVITHTWWCRCKQVPHKGCNPSNNPYDAKRYAEAMKRNASYMRKL